MSILLSLIKCTLLAYRLVTAQTNILNMRQVKQPYLHFVDGLPFFQTLGPHRCDPLVVGQSPAVLAETLRLEAGERLVVRDGHGLRRHGS